jgi:hexosaminidase
LLQLTERLSRKGVTTVAWEEAFVDHDANGKIASDPLLLGYHPLALVWNNIWGEENAGTAYTLANGGYDVVMAQASNLYFDMPYDKDPEEPGSPWAGYVETRQVYGIAPTNFYASTRTDAMGKPIDPCHAFEKYEHLSEAGKQHMAGLQGSLWSETVLGQSAMEYLIFPRLLALAERAWAPQPEWEASCDGLNSAAFARDWNAFANQLGQRELPRLSYLDGGFLYRIPLPGAVIEGGVLKANVSAPGLTIRYTTDGSTPTASSKKYTGPVQVKGQVRLRSFDARERGSRESIPLSKEK